MSNDNTETRLFTDILPLLQLESVDADCYESRDGEPNMVGHASGGQLLAQAFMAAAATVPSDRRLCSLLGTFAAVGVVAEPIRYTVERVRDGRMFCQRTVRAHQAGRCLFRAEVSFKAAEGGYEFQNVRPPGVTPPESHKCFADLRADLPGPLPAGTDYVLARPRPLDMRPVDPEALFGRRATTSEVCTWIRYPYPLPDDPTLNEGTFVYASDYMLGAPVTAQHADYWLDDDHASASLNHALWIHRPLRADDWLLLHVDCPGVSNALALGRGDYYDREGVLVASVSQQMFIRRK